MPFLNLEEGRVMAYLAQTRRPATSTRWSAALPLASLHSQPSAAIHTPALRRALL